MPMLGITFSELLLRLFALLVVSGLFGVLVALAASLLGDKGPRYDGKLTVNPVEHLDLLAIVAFVLFQAGWIKPMAIDPKALRPHPVIGAVAVVASALGALLMVAGIAWANRRFMHRLAPSPEMVSGIDVVTRSVLDMAAWFALLNLVPLPPLAGGILLAAVAPRAAVYLSRYWPVIGIGLLVILWTGWPQAIARPAFLTLLGFFGVRA